jgi:hypothetical protein
VENKEARDLSEYISGSFKSSESQQEKIEKYATDAA